ncbi:unnamed protein product [Didymodactylos carnosus]|uniref:Hemerythrin-like domain-containing protein n=1 Tax=Didymodactylos carnosus TaxID=1234261 RepID=A0A814KH52_9BILA|nr:unnamed protein product [Didymodactylos carnosus]CAF1049389.1 unnamed protein product [Didymodactylos carnosus]CAF3638975.1 unnamed protein product [Didymodactylos carnosus]CAF3819035.1 unnamed protein product [Didymodactylos carnosus]
MTSAKVSRSILQLILSEHQYMRHTYEQLKMIQDPAELEKSVRKWIEFICLHGHKEEIAFYPAVEKYLENGKHVVEHSLNEHRKLDKELKLLLEMVPEQENSRDDNTYWKQIRESMKPLLHHLDDEERKIIIPLQSIINEQEQERLAGEFDRAESVASAKPHPEMSKKAEEAPMENIQIGLKEKQDL